MVKLTFREWCEKYQKDIYIKQWDMVMNGGYTPDSLSYGSTKKFIGIVKKDIDGWYQ